MIEIKKKTASLISRSQQFQWKRKAIHHLSFFFFLEHGLQPVLHVKHLQLYAALISGMRLNKIILLVIYTVLGFNALLVCVVPKNRI